MDSVFLNMSRSHGGAPVVFKTREYNTASDALQAYIADYDGKQEKYYGRKSKYDKQFIDLFCSRTDSSQAGKKLSDKYDSTRKLVQEVYDKLKKDEEDSVQRSLSASMQLMERLDNDKLPSPTRSTILAGGRPSTGSVDTDMLLDAMPTISNTLPKSRNAVRLNRSRSASSNKENTLQNSYSKSSSRYSSRANGNTYSNYEINGMDSLMNNMKDNGLEMSKLSSNHSKSETLDHLLMNHPQTTLVNTHINGRFQHKRNFTNSHLSRSFDSASLQNPDLLSLSQLGHTQNNFSEEQLGGCTNTHNNNLGYVDKTKFSLRTPEKQRSGSRNCSSSAVHDVKASFHDINESMRNFNSGIPNNSPSRTRKNVPLNWQQNMDSNWIPGYLGDSDATSSSIITGHMLKGVVPHKQGLTKVSSTPKRGVTKQLRFEMGDNSKSSVGQGLEIDDLTAIPPDFGQSISKHGTSIDTSFVGKPPKNKPDFAYGRRDIVGILKGNSPGKTNKAMSRVSFTTDDLLNSDPTGLELARPRSRSLPRPLRTFPHKDTTDYPAYRNHALPYSSHKENVNLGNHVQSNRSPVSNSQNQRNTYHNFQHPFAKHSLDFNGRGDNDHSLNISDVKESKYKSFLRNLMKEIDDSASSVATTGGISGVNNYQMPHVHQQKDAGCGFLSRIQNLLASEQIPTVSQYLDPEDAHDSLTTEAVLEGDRPWEKRATFKLPTEVHEMRSDKPNSIFERFMNDCMKEAQGHQEETTTGKSQPGSLEALKNMLFTIQSLSTSQEEDGNKVLGENGQVDYDEAAMFEESDDIDPTLPLDDSISKLLSPETKRLLSNSYSKQPGGPALATAMEHLTKLKDLVEYKE